MSRGYNKNISKLPKGFSDLLVNETKLKNEITEKLREVFRKNKFLEVEPSTVEFINNLSIYNKNFKEKELFKFTNNDNSLLSLRNDFTLQIARIISTKLREEKKPIRVSYFGNVFRNDPSNISELYQAGVEIVGGDRKSLDAEIIILAIKSLLTIGLTDFQINISSTNFYNALGKEKLTLQSKNLINESFGDINSVFKISKFIKHKRTKIALDDVLKVYNEVTQKGFGKYVLIDLAKKPDSTYSTGIFFKGYINGIGSEILNGSRYDNLYDKLNLKANAIGFSISLTKIIEFLLTDKPSKTKVKTLKVALAKGRISKKSIGLLSKAGYDFSNFDEDSRELIYMDKKNDIEYLFVKPSDVTTYVEKGIADLGIVGSDSILEDDKNVSELLDLNFSKCKIVLAGPKKIINTYKKIPVKKIATKYPKITDEYFNSKNEEIKLIKLNGSIELAPITGLSDLIVDLVETGSTLKENGLVVLETIAKSSARLIVNKVSRRIKYKIINKFTENLMKVIK